MYVTLYSSLDFAAVPGYDSATPTERAKCRKLTELMFDSVYGVGENSVVVTSWKRPTDSNSVHATGDAIDFALGSAQKTKEAWLWLAKFRSDYGKVIYEQPSTGVTGHVHLTTEGSQGAQGRVLYQNPDGSFIDLSPASLDPSGAIEIPGIEVVVDGTTLPPASLWVVAAIFAVAAVVYFTRR